MPRHVVTSACLVCCLAIVGCGGDRAAQATGDQPDAYSLAPLEEPPQGKLSDIMDPELMSQELGDLPPDAEPVENHYPEGGLQARGYISDQRPVGPWIYYHPNGSLSMRGDYIYGGRRDGRWVLYDPDGTRRSFGNYNKGREHGEWWYWFSNGILQMRGHYVNGVRDGLWTTFHRNGVRSSEGQYDMGQRTGTWRYWDNSGLQINVSTFHSDLEPIVER